MNLYRGEEQAVRIDTELAPALPAVLADASRLTQVLGNVLQNARGALAERGEGGRVLVRTGCMAPDQRDVFLEVVDDGPGFPPELLERIFDPYVTTKDHGTGLGLAIVRKIVEEHEGRITADNPVGGGARIRIILPMAPEPAETPLEDRGNADE